MIFSIPDIHLSALVETAKKSSCKRSQCGSIIISNDGLDSSIIGTGYNSMPCNQVGECFKDSLPSTMRSDRTCCQHAEVRAIMDTMRNNPERITGSTLLFLRLDKQGNPSIAQDIYCTICSKMALDSGIAFFCLLTPSGWRSFPTDEYNRLSFQQTVLS